MSKRFNDPSLLTKDRLKKELESSGVKLPRGEQKKDFYVKLYRENLSPQSGRRFGNAEFSSDDDEIEPSPQTKEIVPRSSRSMKKVPLKDIVSSDIRSMSDEDLKEELSSLGHPVGPILATTRGLYERKLARLRSSAPNSGDSSVTTITKAEFSDFSEEEQAEEEESIPDDEFFYKRRGQSRRSGDFGSTFTKNFQDSKKEVTRDFTVSSSRNVERTSTVDRQTMNKVRTKKGDKFEEQRWTSSSSRNDDQNYDDEDSELTSLPASVQKALTAAQRFSPEKTNGTRVRARPPRATFTNAPENVPDNRRPTSVDEKPKTVPKASKSSKKCWILLVVLLIVLLLGAAVVYNLERLPAIQKQLIDLKPGETNST